MDYWEIINICKLIELIKAKEHLNYPRMKAELQSPECSWQGRQSHHLYLPRDLQG